MRRHRKTGMNKNNLKEIETIIGYEFKNDALLTQAMTHSSYANERKINKIMNYERIEFLGDAILEGIVSQYLYENYPKKSEGELTKLRASLVCEHTLSVCAKEMQLGEMVLLSKGEELTGGRKRPSILCDLFEALLGSIYLDGGIEPAKAYVNRFLLQDIEKKTLFYDAKTSLQELVQGSNMGDLAYELIETKGPDHNREYVTRVMIGGRDIAHGTGTSIKSAEQMAAYEALLILKNK